MKKIVPVLLGFSLLSASPSFAVSGVSAKTLPAKVDSSKVMVIDVNEELQAIVADMKQQLSEYRTENIQIKAQNSKMKKQLDLKNQEIAKLATAPSPVDTSEYTSKILALTDRVNALMVEKEALSARLVSAAKAQDLSNQNSTFEEKIASLSNEVESLNSQLVSQRLKFEALRQENIALQNREMLAMNYKKQVDELSAKLVSVSNEKNNSVVTSALIKQNQELASAVSENKELMSRLSDCFKGETTDKAVFYYNMGKAYLQMKKYDRAISSYSQALSINPELGNVYCDLGLAFSESGDYERARVAFRQYLEFTKNPAEIELIRGFIKKLDTQA